MMKQNWKNEMRLTWKLKFDFGYANYWFGAIGVMCLPKGLPAYDYGTIAQACSKLIHLVCTILDKTSVTLARFLNKTQVSKHPPSPHLYNVVHAPKTMID